MEIMTERTLIINYFYFLLEVTTLINEQHDVIVCLNGQSISAPYN